MLRLIIILLINYFIVLSSVAQNGSYCPEDLIPKLSENKQWGFTNLLGQWVINPIYTKVSPFVENKAIVMKGLLYGVIDCEGNIVLPPQYERLSNFRSSKAWAKQKGLWGLVNDKGGSVVTPQFTEINPIADIELTWVKKDNLWGLFNEERRSFICKPQFPLAQIMSENASLVQVGEMYGVVNHVNCQYLIEPKIDRVKKVAQHTIIFKMENKWGLFNELGKLKLNAEFDTIYNKQGDLLQAKKNNKWGLYDLSGREITEPKFDQIEEFCEGYFKVKQNGKYGYLSRLGKTFIKPSFEEAGPFKNKKAVVKKNGNWGVIDVKNDFLLKPEYTSILRNFSDDYYAVKKKNATPNKYFLLDKNLNKISNIGFDTVYVSDTITHIRVLDNGKMKFFNGIKKDFSFNGAFDDATPFQNNLSFIKINGKVGGVDLTGKVILPAENDSAYFDYWGNRLVINFFKNQLQGVSDVNGKILFSNDYNLLVYSSPNYLIVSKGGKYGILKTNGTNITEFTYDFISNKKESPDYPSWPAVFEKKGKFGLLNEKGVEVYEPKASKIFYLGEGFFGIKQGKHIGIFNPKFQKELNPNYDDVKPVGNGLIAVKKNEKWGFVDLQDKEVIPNKFEEVTPHENNLAVVKMNGSWGAVDIKGNQIIKNEYTDFQIKNGERLLLKDGKIFKLTKEGILKQFN